MAKQTTPQKRPAYFGNFGGQFVPETLMPALLALDTAYQKVKRDKKFWRALNHLLATYAGRPTPLLFAERLTTTLGGAQIFLKREDLTHTGAHKINNTLGQIQLAKWMGKKRIIAETGAGQHGVATATACARMGMECIVYMGSTDMARQRLNVFRMELLGAKVIPVTTGSGTLKDAINEALRDWMTNVRTTFYLLGSVVGPHPYPTLVRDFQKVIGEETKAQCKAILGRLPDTLVACVGGGSNAMGLFYPFLKEKRVKMVGVEAAGRGFSSQEHAAPLAKGSPGILHGAKSYVLQDRHGQIQPAHSISAGLDYPGVGPEHAWLKETKQVTYVSVTDQEALRAFRTLSRLEGIIPALESAHAIAYAAKLAKHLPKRHVMAVNLSGRGDKDVEAAQAYLTHE